MIVYFADRAMNILGLASDTIQNALRIGDDSCVTEVETGTKTLQLDVYFDPSTRSKVEQLTAVGNYLMRYTGKKDQYEYYTIIDSELDVNDRKINIYCEDGGLDLLNEIVGPFASSDYTYTIKQYVDYYLQDTGFKIGTCEIEDTEKLALDFDGDDTIYARLLSIVEQFNAEMSFSFEIKNLSVTAKYLNIYKERGTDQSVNLRIGREINNIVVKKSVANLCTTVYPIGGIPEGDNGCNSSVDADGKRYYTWVKFASTANGATDFDNNPGSLPYIGLAWDQEDVIESEDYKDYKWFRYQYDKVAVITPSSTGLAMKKDNPEDNQKYMWIRFGENSSGANMKWYPDSNSKYVGIAKNKTEQTPSSKKDDYTWSRYTGGTAKTLYLVVGYDVTVQGGRYAWIKYGTSAAGANMSNSAVGKTYAGIRIAYSAQPNNTTAADYIWSEIKENPLVDGGYVEFDYHLFGVKEYNSSGVAQETYTWIRFAEEDDKGNVKVVESAKSGGYIGFAYHKDTTKCSEKFDDYSWHDVQGDEGVETTLVGYKYDKGDIYIKNGYVYSRAALAKWSRYKDPNSTGKTADGAIVKRISYDYTSQDDLFVAAVYDLYKYSEPEVNYEISVAYLPKNVAIGDRVNVIDDEGQLYVSARVLKTETSECNDKINVTLGEFILKESGISSDVEKLAKEFANYAKKNPILYTWTAYADDKKGTGISLDPDHKAYLGIANNKTTSEPDLGDPEVYKWSYIAGSDVIKIKITSSAGYTFRNKTIATTLTAKVYRNGDELDATAIAKLGVINWYIDDGIMPIATDTSSILLDTSHYITSKTHKISARLEEPDE